MSKSGAATAPVPWMFSGERVKRRSGRATFETAQAGGSQPTGFKHNGDEMNDERLRQIRLLHKELKGYGDDRAPDKWVFIRSTVPRAMGDLLTEIERLQAILDGLDFFGTVTSKDGGPMLYQYNSKTRVKD